MAEWATLARPYATALFNLAKEQDNFEAWSGNLALLLAIVEDPTIQQVIANPKVDKPTLVKLMWEVCCDERTSQAAKNFVKLLVENRRLGAVPQIVLQYEQLKAQHQGYVKVNISTPYPITSAQQQAILEALQKRLHKRIELTHTLDSSLLGGWIIRAGDEVIDLSIKGRLHQLAMAMRH